MHRRPVHASSASPSSRRALFLLGFLFLVVMVIVFVTNKRIYRSARFTPHLAQAAAHHKFDMNAAALSGGGGGGDAPREPIDETSSPSTPASSPFEVDPALAKQCSDSSRPNVTACHDAVREKWLHAPLPDALLDQLADYKVRVAKKVQAGVNGALWKPLLIETRAIVDKAGSTGAFLPRPDSATFDGGVLTNPLRELFASRRARPDGEADDAAEITSLIERSFPECGAFLRDDVQLVGRRMQAAAGAGSKRPRPAGSLQLTRLARRNARATMRRAGDDVEAEESVELLEPAFLHLAADVFMVVKCVREHAELKSALSNAYALLAADGDADHGGGGGAEMSLTAGSLLASTRELASTFIPWDTDVDLMTRPHDEARVHRLLKQYAPEQQRVRGVQNGLGRGGAALIADDALNFVHRDQLETVRRRRRAAGIDAAAADGGVAVHDRDVRRQRDEVRRLDAMFGGRIVTRALDPPKEMAHGRLIGYVYGTSSMSHHDEASRAEIWVSQESRKMQRAALLYPLRDCLLQDVKVRCPAHAEDILVAGYGANWRSPCKAKASNCK